MLGKVQLPVTVLLSLLVVGVLWSVPYVATHDGPNHLANCVFEHRVTQPNDPLTRYLKPGFPITYRGYHAICAGLERAVGWRWAHRLTLTLMALFWAFAYDYLARGIARDHPFRLLGFAFALPWSLYMGFFDYFLACALLLFAAGFVIRRERPSAVGWIEISGALLATALVHVFVAALLGVFLLLLSAARAAQGERMKALGRMILAGVPAALIAVASRGGTDVEPENAWLDPRAAIEQLGATALGGSFLRTWVPTIIALVVLVLAAGDFFRRRAWTFGAAAGVFSALLIAGFFALPFHWSKWAFFTPRLGYLGLAIAPLALPWAGLGGRPGGAWAIAAAVVGFDVASILWAGSYQKSFEPLAEEAMSGLSAPIHRTGARLPLFLVDGPRDLPDAHPLVTMGHLYLLDQGGIDPYLYAEEPLTDSLLYTRPKYELFGDFPGRWVFMNIACAGTRPTCPPLDVQYEWFALEGRNFEDVIMFAPDLEMMKTFERRGYVFDFRKGRLGIARQQKCRFGIDIAGGEGSKAGAELRFSAGRTVVEVPLYEKVIAEGEAIPAQLGAEGPDCGALWISLRFGKTGPPACAEADPGGRILLEATPDREGKAACTLRTEH